MAEWNDNAFDLRMPDKRIDQRLLPEYLRYSDNSRQIRHYKRALKIAIDTRLTTEQKRRILLHYWAGKKKTEIAKIEHSTCSAVSKSIRHAQVAIKEYMEIYMDIYDSLEKERIEDECEND